MQSIFDLILAKALYKALILSEVNFLSASIGRACSQD
jgi:hypothetical protein